MLLFLWADNEKTYAALSALQLSGQLIRQVRFMQNVQSISLKSIIHNIYCDFHKIKFKLEQALIAKI